MSEIQLEHVNITVSAPEKTAAWMERLFGWHVRWKGPATSEGFTIHVGTKKHYVALYAPSEPARPQESSYRAVGDLNHLAVVVDDLEAVHDGAKAEGFKIGAHYDYEPGRRFYFYDHDGIEVEVVSYG